VCCCGTGRIRNNRRGAKDAKKTFNAKMQSGKDAKKMFLLKKTRGFRRETTEVKSFFKEAKP
jgi:hypothetical protein